MSISLKQLEALMSEVICWGEAQEVNALKHGESLDQIESDYARKIGVQYPEKVRLLRVPVMPSFPELVNAATKIDLNWPDFRGMCFRYGIFIKQRELRVIVHELVHTMQYERHGGLSLLHQFVREYFIDGYTNSSLEREAIATEEKFFGPR